MARSPGACPRESWSDRIVVNRLPLKANLRGDAWHRDEISLQPLILTLTAFADTRAAGVTDDFERALDYVALADWAQSVVENSQRQFASLHEAAVAIATACLTSWQHQALRPLGVTVELEQTHGALQADALGVKITRLMTAEKPPDDVYVIKDLRLDAIIGQNDVERTPPQRVAINVEANVSHGSLDLAELAKVVQSHIQTIQPRLIEAMVHSTSLAIFANFHQINQVHVRIAKRSAHALADSMDVAIRRRRDALSIHKLQDAIRQRGQHPHVAVIALGSNLGDRADFLWRALQELHNDPQTQVIDSSYIYESEPMYVFDQPPFLNAACAISTARSPESLLDMLKHIESNLGRTASVDKGPRCIDLDIALFDDIVLDIETVQGRLNIPHVAMSERQFVLQPLADLVPAYLHPSTQVSIIQMLTQHSARHPSTLRRIFPLRASYGKKSPTLPLDGPTHIMSILNPTPDSFSDGGDALSLSDAVRLAKAHVTKGADLIDIGGVSTRPGAEDPGVEEEIDRVIPVISSLRRECTDALISIDTYRAEVARQGLEAGANMLNDVSCGIYPESAGLLDMAAKMRSPIALMHSRGTPDTMSSLTDYGEIGVVPGVRRELAARVRKAMARGIPRWAIMIDPGCGFAKSLTGNLELLRGLPSFASEELQGFPILIGMSRKSTLGQLTGHRSPKDRTWATAATVTAAIQGGAHVVRVHDTVEMRDVVRVSDALYKKRY